MKQIKKAITSFVLIFLPNLILAIEPGETAQKFNIGKTPIIYILLAGLVIFLGTRLYNKLKSKE